MSKKQAPFGPLLGLSTAWMLVACGGGGSGAGADSPSVTTMSATPTRYSQTMIVTVIGRNLDQGIDLVIDGPCTGATRIAGGTSDTVQFSCVVKGVGEIVPRVKSFSGQREIASVKVNIPLPRVSVTLSDGSQSGSFVIELDPTAAPNTVENFLAYATSGTTPFYRSTAVSYADPAMGIRLGGYNTVGSGALALKAATRDPIPVEAGNGLKNERGTVALVQRNAGDPATEWWVSTQDNPTLDRGSAENPVGYTVFGKVVDGLAVVETAAAVPTIIELVSGSLRAPIKPVTITATSQTR